MNKVCVDALLIVPHLPYVTECTALRRKCLYRQRSCSYISHVILRRRHGERYHGSRARDLRARRRLGGDAVHLRRGTVFNHVHRRPAARAHVRRPGEKTRVTQLRREASRLAAEVHKPLQLFTHRLKILSDWAVRACAGSRISQRGATRSASLSASFTGVLATSEGRRTLIGSDRKLVERPQNKLL